jgi:hypothetical protein
VHAESGLARDPFDHVHASLDVILPARDVTPSRPALPSASFGLGALAGEA